MKRITILISLLLSSCLVDVDPYGVDYLYHSDVAGEIWRVEISKPVDHYTYMRFEWYSGNTLKIYDSLSLGHVKIYRAILDEDSKGSDTLHYRVMAWEDTSGRSYLNFDRLSPSKMYLMTNYHEILNDRGYYSSQCLTLTLD